MNIESTSDELKLKSKSIKKSKEEDNQLKSSNFTIRFVLIIVVFAILASYFLDVDNVNVPQSIVSKKEFEDVKEDKEPLDGLPVKGSIEQRELATCQNRYAADVCDPAVKRGGCQTHPGWMSVFCPAACGFCKYTDPKVRCTEETIGYTRTPAIQPGDLSKMFERLPERFPQYNISFLSRPPAGPYVAKFDNFLTDLEIETLLEHSGDLRRSTDQGKQDEHGVQEKVVSKGRTSENAWCIRECESHPVVRGLTSRIEEITLVPKANYESFQLLRYQVGQEYNRHHDASAKDYSKLSGPRILTFFLYLSDVEEGGGTQFTDFPTPITMQPKRGSAIMWPSVMDSDPNRLEPLAFHRAMPVIKGTKFAANHWIHLYDYKKPNIWGCTGSFSELGE